MKPAALNLGASVALIALIVLCALWETVLAPLRPGGSWLVLKVLPLLAPLFGILRGKRYTYQWTSMLALLYLGEGAVRATSDPGASALLGAIEAALAAALFAFCVLYARATAPSRLTTPSRAED